MANLSWLYYKGYYKDFRLWENKKSDEAAIKEFFRKKYKDITDTIPPPLLQQSSEGFALETTYPGLLIGSGYAHGVGVPGETKMGFYFDHTTGLPVIPGSSVKGVLRSAFPQFEPHKTQPWLPKDLAAETEKSKEKARYIGRELLQWTKSDEELFTAVHQLEKHIFEGLNIALSKEKAVYYSLHQRDVFYDASPLLPVGGKKILGMDAITPHPHPLQNPIPLPFVKLLPGIKIRFEFALRATATFQVDAEQRRNLYQAILLDIGVGAKTNVGYGQLKMV